MKLKVFQLKSRKKAFPLIYLTLNPFYISFNEGGRFLVFSFGTTDGYKARYFHLSIWRLDFFISPTKKGKVRPWVGFRLKDRGLVFP